MNDEDRTIEAEQTVARAPKQVWEKPKLTVFPSRDASVNPGPFSDFVTGS
jgi:hypothetical protein